MGIDSWSVGREIRGDVEIGRIVEFPVTAIPIRVEPRANGAKGLRKLAANYYRAAGKVSHSGDAHWVLESEAGIFCRSAIPQHCLDAREVDGVFRLEISFGRFEQALAAAPQLGKLVSAWRVSEILHATSLATRVDWLEGTSVKRGMKLDAVEKIAAEQESSGIWERLERTDWLNDEGGTAHYLFACSRV